MRIKIIAYVELSYQETRVNKVYPPDFILFYADSYLVFFTS